MMLPHPLFRSIAAAGASITLSLMLTGEHQPATSAAQDAVRSERPFGTLREQAAMQQEWLKKRLDTFLGPLMRKHNIDMWVVPMREYMEDPIFTAIVSPTTFAARRRTIYVFFDTCAEVQALQSSSPAERSRDAGPPTPPCVQRIALGGTSQGGVFEARRSARPAAAEVGRGRQAELWGDEQWQVGLSGRRAGARRRQGHSQHVVLNRASGNHAGARMGRPGSADGAGRRRNHRRRRKDPVGAPASGQAVPDPLNPRAAMLLIMIAA